MIETPHVTKFAGLTTAVIHFTIAREEIRSVMGKGIQELLATIAANGIAPSGPVFAHHFRMHPRTFDFEIGVPVLRPVSPKGSVVPGDLPAAMVARTVYHGRYEGLGPAWGEFHAWVAANGHRARPDLWECYVSGPESGPDPAQWRTELNQPLIQNP